MRLAVATSFPVRRERLWASTWGFCLALWLVQRLLVEGTGLLVRAVAGPAPHSGRGFFGIFFNWDSGWFGCIATSGYFGPACSDGATTERFAFFPLYPLLARGAAWVLGAGAVHTAALPFTLWLVAAAASLSATVALFELTLRRSGRSAARRTSALFLFGPYAIFLVASYSESLYLAGAVGAWYFCSRRRYAWCAVLGIVATAARASGLFLVPALLVLYLTTTAREGRRVSVRDLLLVGSSSLGLLGYWAWLAARTNDPLAWFHAQSLGWHRSTRWPWQTLLNQGVHVVREPRWDWQVQAVLEVGFAAGLCVGLVLFLRQRDWPAVALVGLTALSLMTSNSYLSLARNTLTLFPLVLLVVQLCAHRRAAFAVVLTSSTGLLLFNTVQLALGNWAD